MSSTALRALFARETGQTQAPTGRIARRRRAAHRRAVARLTVRIVVVAGQALVAARPPKALLADALAGRLAAHLTHRALQVTIAVQALRIVVEAVLAAVARAPVKIALAIALAGPEVAHIVRRSDLVALALGALGQAVVAGRALLAEFPAKVFATRTTAVGRLTVVALGAVQIAHARSTIRETKVSVRARLAVRLRVRGATLAATGLLLTVAGRVELVAVARLADGRLVPVAAVRPIESVLALVAVDALGVVLTVLADAATLVFAMDVE